MKNEMELYFFFELLLGLEFLWLRALGAGEYNFSSSYRNICE